MDSVTTVIVSACVAYYAYQRLRPPPQSRVGGSKGERQRPETGVPYPQVLADKHSNAAQYLKGINMDLWGGIDPKDVLRWKRHQIARDAEDHVDEPPLGSGRPAVQRAILGLRAPRVMR